MRIGLIGLIVAAWLTWLGAPRLVVEIKNRTPLEQSLQEYLEQWPDNQWLTLHQCHIDLAEAAWISEGEKLYVPLRLNPKEKQAVRIMARIIDEPTLKLMRPLFKMARDTPEYRAYFREHQYELVQERTFSGWLDKSRGMHKTLSGSRQEMVGDFRILDPEIQGPKGGAWLVTGAVLAFAFALISFRLAMLKSRKKDDTTSELRS